MYDHKDAIERFDSYVQADQHNIDDAQDDLRKVAGDQWDSRVRAARQAAGRPVLTINKLPQFINQVSGDIRQSEPSIQPVASDTNTAPVMTEIMAGMVRQIEYQSKASSAYTWGAQCAIAAGIGHWQIVTEYADDTTFDQDVRVKRIMDPLSVTWNTGATELDRSDAMECFVAELVPKEAFQRLYKSKAVPSDFPEQVANTDSSMFWRTDDSVRIASHWYKVPVTKKIGLLRGGQIVDLSDVPPELWLNMGVTRAREVTTHDVMHCKLSGDGVLEPPKRWVGKHIPVVPVIGNEIVVDGKIIRHGLIRFAKDPQYLYNHYRSAQAEVIGTQPKSPYIGTVAMFDGLESMWATANRENLPYLPYKADPDAPGMKPQREPPPQASSAMWQESQIAENDLYGTTGIYPTSLGQKSNEASGRAILARERQSDTGSFIFQDNFKNASMMRTGEILMDLIPKVYDTERYVRILGDDGIEKMAAINMVHNDPFRGPTIINDLTTAKFDVRVKVGTSYASAREQFRELLTELVSANPQLMATFGDLYFDAMDFPGSNKLAARMKKTMPAAVVGEGGAEAPPNPAEEEAAMLQLQKLGAEISEKQAKTKGMQIDNAAKAFQFGATVDAPLTPEPTVQ